MFTKGEWKARQLFNGLGEKVNMIEENRLLLARVYTEANAQLIVEAVNACTSINPDNPLAVAQSIKDLHEACKAMLPCLHPRSHQRPYKLAQQALAKVKC